MKVTLSTSLKSGVMGLGVVALAFSTTSCEPNAGTGALAGAAVGAGIGALAGDDGGAVLKGAAIGAGVGAAAGAIMKARRYKNAGGDPNAGDYPTASRTGRQGIVRSPYQPYGEVDVQGFAPGELAIDPHTNKIFRVP